MVHAMHEPQRRDQNRQGHLPGGNGQKLVPKPSELLLRRWLAQTAVQHRGDPIHGVQGARSAELAD